MKLSPSLWRIARKTRSPQSIPLSKLTLLPKLHSPSTETQVPLERAPEDHLRPVARYIYDTMQKYPNHVVFAQIGGFYEIAFDHADKFGPLLGLRVVQRKQVGLNAAPTFSMAGFPLQSLPKHLNSLVDTYGYKAVILKQGNMDSMLPESERRPIWRIVTPGTLTGELLSKNEVPVPASDLPSVDPMASRPLMAVYLGAANGDQTVAGIAWTDLLRSKVFFSKVLASNIDTEVARILPREILVDSGMPRLPAAIKDEFVTRIQFDTRATLKDFSTLFADSSDQELDFCVSSASDEEKTALNGLLHYVADCIKRSVPLSLSCPESESSTRMRMDVQTKNGLELFTTLSSKGKPESRLFDFINQTLTPSGQWLLHDWLSAPLLQQKSIEARFDVVQMLIDHKNLLQDLQLLLEKGPDCHQTLQRLIASKPDISRLSTFARSVFILEQIAGRLEQHIDRFGAPDLVQKWKRVLFDDLAPSLATARLIKELFHISTDSGSPPERSLNRTRIEMPDVFPRRFNLESHPELLSEVEKLSEAKQRFLNHYARVSDKLEQHYSSIFPNARQISFVRHPRFQYSVRLLGNSYFDETNPREATFALNDELAKDAPGDQLATVSFLWRTSASAYIQDREASKLGAIREGIIDWELSLEQHALSLLSSDIRKQATSMRRVLDAMAQLDVISSFAKLSIQYNLVRPTLSDNDKTLNLLGVRHLVAEHGNRQRGTDYVANDCSLSSQSPLWVISGPNMGGKSTFLRQVAHAVILAQMGCFVPASKAHIGLVDRIYCRIGSSDDVFHEQSTFMIEMLETAMILKNATPKSLTIIDEVGRGSTIQDCMQIAQATVKCLLERNQCRTLFATHYAQELQRRFKLDNEHPDIQYYHSTLEVDKKRKKLIFDYRLKKGLSPRSFGFEIANMAGFPKKALRMAKLYYSRKMATEE